MRINKKQLQEMIKGAVSKHLKENLDKDSDGKLEPYAEKCNKAMDDCRESLAELVEEGEKLVRENLMNAGEKKRLALVYVGVLKKICGVLTNAKEALHRGM